MISCGALFTSAQSYKQLIDYADINAEAGDYYGASIYYKQAMEIDSSKIDLLYKYAEALRKYNNYTKAAYYYEKVWDKDKGGRIYKDASFWLASMQKYNAAYRTASKTWKKVKSKYSRNKKGYEYQKARQEGLSCNYANRIKNDSTENVYVSNIGEHVNTTDSEFAANKVTDKLFFSSLRANKKAGELEVHDDWYRVKQYEAELNDSSVKTSKLIAESINSPQLHNANSSFNAAKGILFFTQCDSLNQCKLVYTKLTNGKWSVPTELPERINAKGTTTTQPNFCEIDGQEYLFFVSNRKGGYGKLDIWYSKILDGNTYSKPINAGKLVNSIDNEVTPFYDTVDRVLYFSSNWHFGKGGFDVFKSKGTPENLTKPENLLAPINTQWNDLYYTIYPEKDNERVGYLTSNRLGSYYQKGPTCCNDIYEVKILNEEKIAENQEIVTLDDLNKYLPVTLYFHNDRPGPRSMDTVVALNYLTTYDAYTSLHPKYKTEYAKGLKDEQALEAELDIDNLFKHYVDKGVSDLNLFTNLLLAELKKGQKIEITIKGFASPLAKTAYNVNLTKRRISSLINYLREYNKGEFIPYLDATAPDGGTLSFVKIPFGEYTASNAISDNYNDQRNSVYSKGAALERKIEIQSVTFAERKGAYAALTVGTGTYDFGKVKQGEVLKHEFIIKNTGNAPLEIVGMETVCSCTKISIDTKSIQPGGQAIFTMELDTKHLEGKQVKSATIFANAFPKIKRLVLTTEIVKE
jgi:hypothetical protein